MIAINATIMDGVEFWDMERAPLALLNPAMIALLQGSSMGRRRGGEYSLSPAQILSRVLSGTRDRSP